MTVSHKNAAPDFHKMMSEAAKNVEKIQKDAAKAAKQHSTGPKHSSLIEEEKPMHQAKPATGSHKNAAPDFQKMISEAAKNVEKLQKDAAKAMKQNHQQSA